MNWELKSYKFNTKKQRGFYFNGIFTELYRNESSIVFWNMFFRSQNVLFPVLFSYSEIWTNKAQQSKCCNCNIKFLRWGNPPSRSFAFASEYFTQDWIASFNSCDLKIGRHLKTMLGIRYIRIYTQKYISIKRSSRFSIPLNDSLQETIRFMSFPGIPMCKWMKIIFLLNFQLNSNWIQ